MYGFIEVDLDCLIFIDNYLGFEKVLLCEIFLILKWMYCGIFGVEFMYMIDFDEKVWI